MKTTPFQIPSLSAQVSVRLWGNSSCLKLRYISLWIIVRLWKQVPLRYLPNRRRYHCNLWAAVCQYSLTLSTAWSASPVNLCVILAFNALHSYTAAAMLTIYNVNYNPQPEAPVLLIACVSLTQASFYLSVSLMLLYNMKTNILQTIARTGFITVSQL